MHTIDDVGAAVGDQSCPQDLPEGGTLSFLLENDPSLLPGVLARIVEAARRFRLFDEATIDRVCLALHEAMLNGIHHGNLELDSTLRQGDETDYQRLAATRRRGTRYRRRRLHVEVRFGSDAATFIIRDEGRGFDPARLPDPATDPTCLERPSGRGLLLIRAFMDEVSFNATGTQITLVKRRSQCVPRNGLLGSPG